MTQTAYMRKPTTEFIAWSSLTVPSEGAEFTFQDTRQEDIPAHLRALKETLKNQSERIKQITIAGNVLQKAGIADEFVLDKGNDVRGEINRIIIKHLRPDGPKVVLRGLAVHVIDVYECTKSLRIENCDIGRLNMAGSMNVTLRGTNIGKLNANHQKLSIECFDMQDGAIIDFDFPPARSQNPFVGNVSFSNVFLPRTTKNYPITGAQQLRNVTSHLMDIHNLQAASLFQSAVLALERETDASKMSRGISHLYEWFSDFGTSITRPSLWIIGTWVVVSLVYFFVGGIVVAGSETELYGYKLAFSGDDKHVYALRAAYYAALSSFNPLGILGGSFLVPTTVGLWWLSRVHLVFNIIWITLLVLAIRRRFKIVA